MRVTNEIFDKRLKAIQDAGRYILSNEPDMVKACVQSGLTEGGAGLDIGLMWKQMLNLELDRDRLVGKEVGDSAVLAAMIPFDVPNFMVPFYCGSAYVAGKDVVMRFGESAKPIGALWRKAFEETKAPNIRTEDEMDGPDFGQWAIEQESVRHLILAGGTKLLRAYTKKEVTDRFDSIVISGPTRPKAIIDATMKPMLDFAVKTTVDSAFYGSGQLCALEKEVIPEEEIYDDVKELLIEKVRGVDYGTPQNIVGPLGDKWVIIGLAAMYDRIKDDPKYGILVGGGYDKDRGIFEPTLVEAPSGIDDNIHYFGPMIFMNGATRGGMNPIEVAKSDGMHGGYCYAWTQDVLRGLQYEGELKQDFGVVRINATIFSSFFDWPFGGFKKSFIALRREEEGMVEYHGRVHHAYMLTRPTRGTGD
jgi:acyl-CoA reductase-like NAD-dependent aldehyde dehydrogenase